MSNTTISPAALAHLRKEREVQVIDVCTPMEYRQVHAEGARLIPLNELDARKLADRVTPGEPLYLLCQSGNRASTAAQRLREAGADAVVVEGGTTAWEAAGLPVERGKAGMSLERQVRIVAGLMVLLGVLLGYAVHAGFFLLSGFVGVGLIFAGVTDFCGMGLLLARMPWNRGTPIPACSTPRAKTAAV